MKDHTSNRGVASEWKKQGALLMGALLLGMIVPAPAQKTTTAGQKPTAPPVKSTKPQAAKPDSKKPEASKLEPFEVTLPGSAVKMQMVPVPGGTVKIGDKTVTVKPFYIAKTETAWEEFDAFYETGENSPPYDQTEFTADAIARPSRSYILPDLGWGHNGYPAINVSHLSATMYCRWMASNTKKKFRLPTEAEWELACRAGTTGDWKLDKDTLEKSAWYLDNSEKTTHPVGKKQPNKFGLHDMLGNTGEWANDAEGKPVVCGGAFSDPAPDQSPTTRKRQTPKWQETDPQFPKSRWWLADAPFAGFRVVCEP